MSTQQNADGTIPEATNPAQVAIVSSTNATPIVVTTGTHGYATGDTVSVEGHKVNTAANGLHTIIVISPTTFSLVGSTGNGVGGATGYVIDYAVNPLIALPADIVDPLNAASINPAIEGIFNAVPYLYMRTGKYRLYDEQVIASDGSTLASYPNSWTSLSIANNAWTVITATETVYPNAIGLNDIIDVEIDFMLATGATGSMVFGVGVGFSIAGGSWFLGGSFEGNGVPQFLVGNVADGGMHIKYFGQIKVASLPIAAGDLKIGVMGFQNSGGALTIQLYKPYQIKVRHLRSNA